MYVTCYYDNDLSVLDTTTQHQQQAHPTRALSGIKLASHGSAPGA
jgi:hypothetical protein